MLKKLILCLTVFLLFPIVIEASEKEEVDLKKCVDGDTAWFILNDEEIKARFLAIDTPESTTTVEAYGKEQVHLLVIY